MSRRAFITDIDTALGAELARLYIDSSCHVFGTINSRDSSEPDLSPALKSLKESAGELLHIETWHRHSPISAKNMILKALACFDVIDEFLLIGNPFHSAPALHSIEFRLLDKEVDSWIKGNLFLLREILVYTLEKNSGILTLICLNHNHPESSLEETIRQGFLALADSLFKTYSNKGITINAFESQPGLIDEFAAYIFRHMSERGTKISGKLFKYRKGLLSNLSAG